MVHACHRFVNNNTASDEAVQLGASMVLRYDEQLAEISSENVRIAHNAQQTEAEFESLAGYLNTLNHRCQEFHHQVTLVPPLQKNVQELTGHIALIGERLNILEDVLDVVHARKHAARIQAWERSSAAEIKQLRAAHESVSPSEPSFQPLYLCIISILLITSSR